MSILRQNSKPPCYRLAYKTRPQKQKGISMSIIYISAPVHNIPDKNRKLFEQAERELTALGHTVVNPLKIVNEQMEDREVFDIECSWICRKVERIVFLPGWYN